MGDTDREGKASSEAWKEYGFDLDGYRSDEAFSGHCRPQAGGDPKAIRVDGAHGIDNALGHQILPLLTKDALIPPSVLMNETIAKAFLSGLFKLDKIDSETDATLVPASFFFVRGARWPANGPLEAPTETEWQMGTYPWVPWGDSLDETVARRLFESKYRFPSSYLVNDAWVAGPKVDVPIDLAVLDIPFTITLHSALINIKFDRASGAAEGTVGGIFSTEEVVDLIRKTRGIIPGLCDDAKLNQWETSIRQASDSLLGGGQDQDQTCDGISVGLGFGARPAQINQMAHAGYSTEPTFAACP